MKNENTLVSKNVFLLDSGMSEKEKKVFFDALEQKVYASEEAMVTIGERGEDGMYIITKGNAVVKNKEGEIINELHEGDYFGELALLFGDGRKATVQAVGEVEVARIPKEVYDNLILRNPKNQGFLFSNLYRNLSEKHSKIMNLIATREKYTKMFNILIVYFCTMIGLMFLLPKNLVFAHYIRLACLIGFMVFAFYHFKIKAADMGFRRFGKEWYKYLIPVTLLIIGIVLMGKFTGYGSAMRNAFSAEVGSLGKLNYAFCITLTNMVNLFVFCGFMTLSLKTIHCDQKHVQFRSISSSVLTATVFQLAVYSYYCGGAGMGWIYIGTLITMAKASIFAYVVYKRENIWYMLIAEGISYIFIIALYLLT